MTVPFRSIAPRKIDDLPAYAIPVQAQRLIEDSIAEGAVSVLYPGHGPVGGFELIEKTRTYLRDFREAVGLGNADAAQRQMLSKYPHHHAAQFLTAFSIPAYFT